MANVGKLIGLTGTNGAGKGEAAAFFRENGFAYFSLSDVLRHELRMRRLETSRDNLILVGNQLREAFGADVLARRVMERVALSGGGPVVIDSIRNLCEVNYFRAAGGFVLLAFDAPIEIRFNRVAARGRNESAASLEDFRRKEDEERAGGETAQQLDACMAAADHLIVNDGTIDELRRKLERFL